DNHCAGMSTKNLFVSLGNVERKYAMTFWGLVVGVIGTLLALYPYFEKRNPALRMEVTSSANLIDVKQDVVKLDILFNGYNLREKNQTLSLVTVKISNDGGAPITKASYDDAAPLGLEVSKGEITRAEIIGTSSEYLTNAAKIVGALPSSLPMALA